MQRLLVLPTLRKPYALSNVAMPSPRRQRSRSARIRSANLPAGAVGGGDSQPSLDVISTPEARALSFPSPTRSASLHSSSPRGRNDPDSEVGSTLVPSLCSPVPEGFVLAPSPTPSKPSERIARPSLAAPEMSGLFLRSRPSPPLPTCFDSTSLTKSSALGDSCWSLHKETCSDGAEQRRVGRSPTRRRNFPPPDPAMGGTEGL